MKTILSLTLLLFMSTNASAALTYMPEHYLTGEEVSLKSDDLKPTSDFIDSVLKTEHEILESKDAADAESRDSKKFTMNLMMTNLTITKTGLVGISALKANEFVSLFWTRKMEQQKAVEEVHNTVEFDGEATEEELTMNANELGDTLYSSGLVKNKEAVIKNLKAAMTKANETFGVIETMSYGNWDVSGLRLDLNVAVSGIVTPYTKVGANTRVWIEWRRVAKPTLSTKVLSKGGKKLQEFVSKVLSDVDLSANNVNLKSFHLSQMYIGLGQDYKTGFFGLGSSNFGFIGYVILNHKPNAALNKSLADTNDELPVIRKNIFQVSRKKLRSSIQKTMNLGAKLVNNAEKIKSEKWEVSRIRLTTTLSQSGFFGLSALNTKGVFIHIFERNTSSAFSQKETAEQAFHQWELSLVRISFVADVGVQIPWIANASLQPQIEFIWR